METPEKVHQAFNSALEDVKRDLEGAWYPKVATESDLTHILGQSITEKLSERRVTARVHYEVSISKGSFWLNSLFAEKYPGQADGLRDFLKQRNETGRRERLRIDLVVHREEDRNPPFPLAVEVKASPIQLPPTTRSTYTHEQDLRHDLKKLERLSDAGIVGTPAYLVVLDRQREKTVPIYKKLSDEFGSLEVRLIYSRP